MKTKEIPKKIRRQIRYVRGQGYKIVGRDGKLSPETYYSQGGAAMMLMGTFHSYAFNFVPA